MADRVERLRTNLDGVTAREKTIADVIGQFARAFDAVDGVMFELNRRTGEIRNWVSPSLRLDDGFDDAAYSQHINTINPRMQYSMTHAPGHVVTEAFFISQDRMARHEFYDWLARENGLQVFMGSRILDEGDVSLFHSIEFGLGARPPDREDLADFREGARQLADAWLVQKRNPNQAGDGLITPDHLPWGIFGLNASGEVVEMNAHASLSLQANRFLMMQGRSLLPVFRPLRDRFSALLSDALSGLRGDMLLKSQNNQDGILQLVPTAGTRHQNPNETRVQAFLWDPAASSLNRADALRSLWGLSGPEIHLVDAMDRGETLDQAAESLGISRNTARNHLQSVFSKMGVNRQSEVMRHLGGLLVR